MRLEANDRLVNQGVLYLKSATTGNSKIREKGSGDAQRLLTQALTTGVRTRTTARGTTSPATTS